MKEIIIAIIGVIGVTGSSLITTIATIKKENKKQSETFRAELDTLKKEQTETRIDSLKNFIVRCLDDLERNISLNETTKERLYEALDTYSNKYHQNSYIHKRVLKLEKEGLL